MTLRRKLPDILPDPATARGPQSPTPFPMTTNPKVQGICPTHKIGLQVAPDNSRYCPRCAANTLRQDAADNVQASSAQAARRFGPK